MERMKQLRQSRTIYGSIALIGALISIFLIQNGLQRERSIVAAEVLSVGPERCRLLVFRRDEAQRSRPRVLEDECSIVASLRDDFRTLETRTVELGRIVRISWSDRRGQSATESLLMTSKVAASADATKSMKVIPASLSLTHRTQHAEEATWDLQRLLIILAGIGVLIACGTTALRTHKAMGCHQDHVKAQVV
jgi:hypothetical protein